MGLQEQLDGESSPKQPCETKNLYEISCRTALLQRHERVHHVFQQRARSNPDAVAVQMSDKKLTYSELDSQASQLAFYLLQKGVGRRGQKVPLVCTKSEQLIIGQLAILKTGAAVAILNPAYPVERLRNMLSSLGSNVCISDQQSSNKVAGNRMEVIKLPPHGSYTNGEIQRPIEVSVSSPEDPAVVVFTSGSTGNPKGVVHQHASVSTIATAMAVDLELDQHTRLFQFAAPGWIVSVMETFATLFSGGTVCMPTAEEISEGLLASIKHFRSNFIGLPPSLAESLGPHDIYGTHKVLFAGENTPSGLVEQWERYHRIFINYGSSEAGCPILSPVVCTKGKLWIQRCSASTRLWLVDPDDTEQLVEGEGIGELIVEGSNIALAYVEYSTAGTTCSFIEEPHWRASFPNIDQFRPRFNRMGDLFRRDEVGRLSPLGRKDGQMKVRGQRVEPGDVEHHVHQLVPQLKELACVKGSLRNQSKDALVVFVRLDPPVATETIQQLKGIDSRLAAVLPSYMIPTGYMRAEELPRTASGKIDRRLLVSVLRSTPMSSMLFQEQISVAIQANDQWNSEGLLMCRLWQDILQCDPECIGPYSHFFRLGGDSIDAMKLVRTSRGIGISLSVAQIFSFPILSDLVEHSVAAEEDSLTIGNCSAFTLLPGTEKHGIIDEAAKQCSTDIAQVEDILPCTPLQTGLMVLSQQVEGAYIASHRFSLPRTWSLQKAEEAWRNVVESSGVLRSRIIQLKTGKSYQVVLSSTCLDTSNIASNMSFGEPLFQWKFVKSELGCSGFMDWKIHHALCDGWTTGLMIDALVDHYHNRESSTAPSHRWSSFVRFVESSNSEAAKSYWKTHLTGYEGQSFPRHSKSTPARPDCVIRAESEVVDGPSNVTLPTIMKTAWGLLLARYSGTQDVSFGVVSTGRTAPVEGIESLIGPTLTTVPYRFRFSRNESITRCLSDVQQQSMDMLVFEQLGLQDIMLLGSHGPKQAASFQSLLIIQPEKTSAKSYEAGVEQVDCDDDYHLTYPITLECATGRGKIAHMMSFDKSSVSPTQARRVLCQYIHVLGQLQNLSLSTDPISRLSFVSKEDQAELSQWAAEPPRSIDTLIHDTIISRAQNYPATTAVSAWDGEISYEQLVCLSSGLAWRLVDLGVSSSSVVPIYSQKSMFVVIALLAVLRSGAAFVLVDENSPSGRIRSMFETVAAKVVLCSYDQKHKLRDIDARPLWLNDFFQSDSDTFRGDVALPKADPSDPAYIVFTSGTTGTPKASCLEHRQVASGFHAQVERGLFRPGWRMLQFASYNFDPCIGDMLGPLLVGGCICIPREQERILELAACINKFKVDYVELTPSVANLVRPEEVPGLKVLRLGGEAVTQSTIGRWAGQIHVENSYGPSECCVTCTLADNACKGSNPASMGRPFGCYMWIVDPETHGQLQPIGAAGELVIQGPIVFRGYLRNPQATSRSLLTFTPWLEEGHPARQFRAYLTGDFAFHDDTGSLVYAGRGDDQVKIRGQRIELGEIESNISAHDNVKNTIALLLRPKDDSATEELGVVLDFKDIVDQRGENADDPLCLVDSITLQDRGPILVAIQRTLGAYLPAYMIPTTWLAVNYMPLTSSGKIDRKAVKTWSQALSADDKRMFQTNGIFQESHGALPTISEHDITARKILNLIRELTGHGFAEDKGGMDMFIANAGLDSIKVVSLVRSINKDLAVNLKIEQFLRQQTVKQLAREIDKNFSSSNGVDDGAFDAGGLVERILKDVDALTNELRATSAFTKSVSHNRSGFANVLLTGAAGYVGCELLHALLDCKVVDKVHVIVRAPNTALGMGKVENAARLAGWWEDSFRARICIWVGDLSKPRLGLQHDLWRRLIGEAGSIQSIDGVIHNGAAVNWYSNYESLRDVNVISVQQFLGICCSNKYLKRFVHISGGPQWHPYQSEKRSGEDLRSSLINSNGYGQSKIASELLVTNMSAKPKPLSQMAAIIKPGLIIGSESRGVPNTDDFIWRLVSGCVAIGAYPEEEEDSWAYICPTNVFADITLISLLGACRGINGHTAAIETKILWGLRPSSLWSTVQKALLCSLFPMRHCDWMCKMESHIMQVGQNHPCWPVQHMLEDPAVLGGPFPNREDPALLDEIENRVVAAFQRNVVYLRESGFFEQRSGAKAPLSGFSRQRTDPTGVENRDT